MVGPILRDVTVIKMVGDKFDFFNVNTAHSLGMYSLLTQFVPGGGREAGKAALFNYF